MVSGDTSLGGEDQVGAQVLDAHMPSWDVREQHLPLPQAEHAYSQILVIGATGAGKTTFIRQLLGTHPQRERFPSTSTAKTTVADTEVILFPGPDFHATVTFAPFSEIRTALSDNVTAAVVACAQGRTDYEVVTKLLDHVSQRYRFSYSIGPTDAFVDPAPRSADADDDDWDDDDDIPAAPVDISPDTVAEMRAIVGELKALAKHLPDGQLLDDAVDAVIRAYPTFEPIVDRLVALLQQRVDQLPPEQLRRDSHGWPRVWNCLFTSRPDFITAMAQLTSNHSEYFGRLLTPMVDGIRVAAPFQPSWMDSQERLVLVDGEGLGHYAGRDASLSNKFVHQLQRAQAVILVDNAAQPMQTAAVNALKAIEISGQTNKLHFVFTHFDLVKGPNLRSGADRKRHIVQSAENAIEAIRQELGPAAASRLSDRLESSCVFFEGLQDLPRQDVASGRRTLKALRKVVADLRFVEAPTHGDSLPVYTHDDLRQAIGKAARECHSEWRARFGITESVDVPKAHWARVRTLSRCMMDGQESPPQDLDPIADMRMRLQENLYRAFLVPQQWTGEPPTDAQRLAIVDQVTSHLTPELANMCEQLIQRDRIEEWRAAFVVRGPGSAKERANLIYYNILSVAFSEIPSQGQAVSALLDVVVRGAQAHAITVL